MSLCIYNTISLGCSYTHYVVGCFKYGSRSSFLYTRTFTFLRSFRMEYNHSVFFLFKPPRRLGRAHLSC